MKKTHSANIGGTVFHIEEDAYERLQDYLQSIHTHFHFYPDVAEIVADIEGRIAEQLQQRELAPPVVRLADVERVIEAMGRIEQFDEPVSDQAAPRQPRRLFRDPEHKVIAGVAAGLAAYLGVPRLAVRLLLVLLLFFFGSALVVYLLLWALVPMAASTTDRLQMRGRPLTLASIDQGVRDGIASIPTATRSAATRSILAAGSLIHMAVLGVARALRWAVGVLVVGIATLAVLALTALLVVALVNASAPPLHPDAAAFLAVFGTWQHVFKVLLYLLVAIPLALVIATACRLFWGARHLNNRGLAGLLGVWVVALLATAAIWSGSYPQLRQHWDEYPASANAHRDLERFSALAAPTSPLSAEQSRALLATLVAEHRRLAAQDDLRGQYLHGPAAWLELEEQNLRAKEESHRRIVESARGFLDEPQLALLEDSLAQYSTRMQGILQARRERLEARGP
jgi:phage shock protein PspC (stress-responsive transcriptional regulator)